MKRYDMPRGKDRKAFRKTADYVDIKNIFIRPRRGGTRL